MVAIPTAQVRLAGAPAPDAKGGPRYPSKAARSEEASFEIRPRPPFRLLWTAWALRRRPNNLIDRWDGATYRRVLMLDREDLAEVAVHQTGTLRAPRLRVTITGLRVSTGMESEARRVLARMLGVRVDLAGFYRLAQRKSPLATLARSFRGLKPPSYPTVFEALVNGVACQQLSLAVGLELLGRLARACGRVVESPEGVRYAFPQPADLVALRGDGIRQLGFSSRKAESLVGLARRISNGEIDLERLRGRPHGRVVEVLDRLPGIGRWTAEYALLRGLSAWDVFPGDDVGARQALARLTGRPPFHDYASVQRATRPWAPYAGIVYFHLLLGGLQARGAIGPVPH
ncbi:MAG TPA: DNA-3-methyladenine glycosylase 2 family protein [Thermoplasmata archaeon]|nr:DNA-3-methyladenine glycosylase 2 family protein [Thermoplasmata archaeon]